MGKEVIANTTGLERAGGLEVFKFEEGSAVLSQIICTLIITIKTSFARWVLTIRLRARGQQTQPEASQSKASFYMPYRLALLL